MLDNVHLSAVYLVYTSLDLNILPSSGEQLLLHKFINVTLILPATVKIQAEAF
jgi:hypothetical protein